MIARGDCIGGAAIGDSGNRTVPTEWSGPAMPMPSKAPPKRSRRMIARR